MKNIDSIAVVNTDTIAVEYKKLRLINDTIADMLKGMRGKYETWKKFDGNENCSVSTFGRVRKNTSRRKNNILKPC